jgi:hypothetical protein
VAASCQRPHPHCCLLARMFNSARYIVAWITVILDSMGCAAEVRMNLLDAFKRCSPTPKPHGSSKWISIQYHKTRLQMLKVRAYWVRFDYGPISCGSGEERKCACPPYQRYAGG